MLTAEQVKAAILNAHIIYIKHHKCSICDKSVGYVVQDGEVYFDSSCACTASGLLQNRSWQDLADFILFLKLKEKPEE